MIQVDPVTSRYTQALFELAIEKGKLDEVKGDVERLASEVEDARVRSFLSNPRVARDEKRRAVAPLLETLDPLTRAFVQLLLDRGREQVLLGIGLAFKKRVLDRRGATEGVVESARPLDEDEITRLAEAVGARIGKEVHLDNRVAPELIGGVRVFVDNRLVDQSVRGRLEGLRKKLHDAPLPAVRA